MRPLLNGILASLVTPFHPDGSIDWDGLGRENHYLNNSPVHGIYIGGVLSGMAGAAPQEFFSLAQQTRKATSKPLAAMLFPDTLLEAHELIESVIEGGVTTVLVAQPHYLCQPTHDDLADMFADLRRSFPIPIVVADCLPDAALGFSGIQSLMKRKVVDGVLEAHDAHVLVDLLALRSGFPILCGVEDLHYIGLLLGAHGVVSDLATAFPEEIAGLYRSSQDGRHSAARHHHERLCRLWRAFNSPVERSARLRTALSAQGRTVGPPRCPYDVVSEGMVQTVRLALQREGVQCQSH